MGIIYELVCLTTNTRYIGSSKISKEDRLKYHEKHYKSYLNNKHNFVSSFNILKNNNYLINVIENVADETLLKDREQFYYENTECVNINNPKQTLSVLRLQQKKDNDLYKLRNPEKYKEHQDKRNILIECSCGSFVSKRNIAKHIKTHK